MPQLLVLRRHARGDAEVNQRQPQGLRINQDVVGVDVLVNDFSLVEPAEYLAELNAELKKGGEVHPPGWNQGLEA